MAGEVVVLRQDDPPATPRPLGNGARAPILLAPMTAPGAACFAPHALMTAMIAIWGGSYAVVKVSLDSLSPFAVIALRFWISVLCLLPFVRRQTLAELGQTWKLGLAAGFVLGLGYLLQTVGMNGTTASMGGFLAGLIVPLVALGGFVVFRTRFGAGSIAGLLLGIAGITLLCWPGGEETGKQDTPLGIGLQLGSSASYAVHILTLSRFGKGLPTVAFCLWQLTFVAIAATVAGFVEGNFAAVGTAGVTWTPQLILLTAYLGVLATALGIGVQSKVQHRVPSTHLALLFALQPLFAALFGWLTIGDQMSSMQMLGGALIVVGVIVTSLDG
jgi:drug/metabolite transporter (DMT)-like permease